MGRVIRDDAEALAAASRLAGACDPAFACDPAGASGPAKVSLEEVGLLAIGVPARLGGPALHESTPEEALNVLASSHPAAAVRLRHHLVAQQLVLERGSPAQAEFFASEALAGRRFACTYAALRAARPPLSADETDGAVRGVRLLPRVRGGRLLIGTQEAPPSVGGAAWVVVVAREADRLVAAAVPGDAPRLSLSTERAAVVRLAGVRVLDSWLLPSWAPMPAELSRPAHALTGTAVPRSAAAGTSRRASHQRPSPLVHDRLPPRGRPAHSAVEPRTAPRRPARSRPAQSQPAQSRPAQEEWPCTR